MADGEDERTRRLVFRVAIVFVLATPVIGMSVGSYFVYMGRKSPADIIAQVVIFLLVVAFFWRRIRDNW